MPSLNPDGFENATKGICLGHQIGSGRHNENFVDFMSKLGVSYMIRKLGNASSPVVTVTENENVLTFKQESLVKTSEFSCQLGVPFDETSADGRKLKSTMSLEQPNVLKHEMLGTEGGKDSVCVRGFFKDKMKR